MIVHSSGYRINKSNKCVYSKLKNGKGVIICLYIDDMLIFGIDLEEVNNIKKFLCSNSSMIDTGITRVILGIKIKK